jgi:hypothetical protein
MVVYPTGGCRVKINSAHGKLANARKADTSDCCEPTVSTVLRNQADPMSDAHSSCAAFLFPQSYVDQPRKTLQDKPKLDRPVRIRRGARHIFERF